jgi:GNAT superfamily N-acetyltransferase
LDDPLTGSSHCLR